MYVAESPEGRTEYEYRDGRLDHRWIPNPPTPPSATFDLDSARGSSFEPETTRATFPIQVTADPHTPTLLPDRAPEPPVGSVVLDREGRAWQRTYAHSNLWVRTGSKTGRTWTGLLTAHGPLFLIHREDAR